MAYLKIILRGVAQVMLQENAITGLFFLIGIFYNSFTLGIVAVFGTIISTLTAQLLNYNKTEIKRGLYGFNGALCAIALWFFYGFSPHSFIVIIFSSSLSSVLFYYLKRFLPPYTAPFILSTWIGMLTLKYFFGFSILSAIDTLQNFSFIEASLNSYGQVMFQKNSITGLFFLTGILINSGLHALFTIYAVFLSLIFGLLLGSPMATLNSGLLGFNAILCVIVLADINKNAMLWATLAILLSVLIHLLLWKINIIPLTAAFVITSWLLLGIKKFVVLSRSKT